MSMDRNACLALDARDPIAHLRDRFVMPEGEIYLSGNSLGCLPKSVAPRLVQAVSQEWGTGLIRSWNEAGWYLAPQRVGARIAALIGAGADDVIAADSTSVNLFKVLAAGLRLRAGRSKILAVAGDFPTDSYIAQGIAAFADVRFIRVNADDLIASIDEDVAIISLTHVNYRSGFIHDMGAITQAAHDKGALSVWDLSHSAGAMDLHVDALRADFAVGCGYKYLNGGPGAPAYVFVAKRHQSPFHHPLTGWLGHADPFAFAEEFTPAAGMDKVLSGTPPILSLLALDAALDVFDGVKMEQVRAKSQSLTGLFVSLADERLLGHGFVLASPRDASVRGAQVSLAHEHGSAICQVLIGRGVIGDFRAPDLVRFGLAPVTTRHIDVYDAVDIIDSVMKARAWDVPAFKSRKAVT